ncbi:hypothetical protein Peur_058321 [Populus x canadensis]
MNFGTLVCCLCVPFEVGMPRLDSDIEQKASLFVFLSLFYKSQELNILGGCRGMFSDEILELHALFYPNSQGSSITSFRFDRYISQV